MRRDRSVAIFASSLIDYGGAERVLFEEADHLARAGFATEIVTHHLDERVRFAGAYRQPITVIGPRDWARTRSIGKFARAQAALLGWLRRRRPGIVVALSATECALLAVPARFLGVPYVAHINGTIFWFPRDLTKYSLVHRSGLRRILARSPHSSPFVAAGPPRLGPGRRARMEMNALAHWVGVRGARRRITFSRRMSWEVEQLYGVPADTLKGAFPRAALSHVSRRDPLAPFRAGGGPLFLNVNRLESRKRVDLAIRAFALFARTSPGARLVVAGLGPDRAALEQLARELGQADRVTFVGFIPEGELWDWLASCDVFVHPNWAEFAIAPFEALAMATKVVWSTEMELDPPVERTGLVFPAEPEVGSMAGALARAAAAPRADPAVRLLLDEYTWESYFERLGAILDKELGG